MSVLVAFVVLAWIAILLLGLAVGGLLAQVRAMEARRESGSVAAPPMVARIEGIEPAVVPVGAFCAMFVESGCDVCHHALPELLALTSGPLLVVTDELAAEWAPLPEGVPVVVDPGAANRSHVPAVPWFAAVDSAGRTVESFGLGNRRAVHRAARITNEISQAAQSASDPSPDKPTKEDRNARDRAASTR